MANPTREDTWLTTVGIGTTALGVFDTGEGFEADSEEAKYRPGGMNDELSLGGRRTLSNVTVSRYFDIFRDGPLIKWLFNSVGMTRGWVSRQPLTPQGQPAGEVAWFYGTLKRVAYPDVDSMGTDAALLEIEFTIDEVA